MGKNKSLKKLSAKNSERLKIPKSVPDINYNSFKPTFSFRHMQYQCDWCLSKCQRPDKSSFVDTLLRLSQHTWSQISSFSREALGYEKINRDSLKIKSLPPILTPEVNIIGFRFSNSGRMAGFRDNDVFHVIFIDPNHNLW